MYSRELFSNLDGSSDEGKATQNTKKPKKSRKKIKKVENILSEAYYMYGNKEYGRCMAKLQDALKISSTNPLVYQTMGVILEEQGEIEKAFYFYIIAANIKKIDLTLWKKLYFMTYDLNMLEERAEFLTRIQVLEDSEDIILEKIEIYQVLGFDEKFFFARIELMKYRGFDDDLIEDICKKMKKTTKIKNILKKLLSTSLNIRFKTKIADIHRLVYVCFKARYFCPLPGLFEKVIINMFDVLPLEYELIYIVSKFMCKYEKIHLEGLLIRLNDITVTENIFLVILLYDTLFSNGYYEDCYKIIKILDSCRKKIIDKNSEIQHINSKVETCESKLFSRHKINNAILLISNDDNLLLNKLGYDMVIRSNIYLRKKKVWDFVEEYNTRYAPLLVKLDRKEEGLRLYLEIYNENPLDYLIKQTISDLYHQLGALDLAKQYQVRYESLNIIDDLVSIDKTMFRYSIEDCNKNKQIYEDLILYNPLKPDGVPLEKIKLLYTPIVEDCRNNPFMFKINRKFRNLMTEDERLSVSNGNCADSKVYYLKLRLMSLHGLYIEEWFVILRNYCLTCFLLSDWEEFKKTVESCLLSHAVRANRRIHTYFVFLGIKYSISNNDLAFMIICVKKLEYNSSNKFIHFVYFFSNFISSGTKIADFMSFQRNYQRYYFIKIKKKLEGSIIEHDEDETIGMMDEPTDFYKYLNGCLPNFLYSSTLDKICYLSEYHKKAIQSEIILASIFICQSLSRRVRNRKYLIDRGFKILFNLEAHVVDLDDKCAVWYNIGRGYHQFSILGMADRFYRKSLVTKNKELKRMALFNLMLIYKNNGSKTLYNSMMKIFDET